MLTAGIILFIVGVAVAILTEGRVEQLGYVVAVIGIAAIVLALLLDLGEGNEIDALIPLLGARLLKARLG